MAALTGAILATLAVANTVKGVADSRSQARGARKQGEYEGEMYDKQAADAIARGEEGVAHIASDSRGLTGAQRTSLAASGVDVGTGSAADVQSSDQKRALLDEAAVQLNAGREAFGFTEQGKLARMGARNQAQAYANAGTSNLLAGASDLYSKYRAFRMNSTPRISPATGDLGPTSPGAQARGYNP